MKIIILIVISATFLAQNLVLSQAPDSPAREKPAQTAPPTQATTATASGFGFSAAETERASAPEVFFTESAPDAFGYNLLVGSTAPASGRSLIIPKDAPDPKSLAEAEEDLKVMARILDKAATSRGDHNPRAMGIDVHTSVYGSASSSPRNLYLEGYGAVFFMNVDFPVVPPVTKTSDADVKEETSSEWEEARRELFRPNGGLVALPGMAPSAEQAGPEYDADKVEDFKQDLINALKNASHIRRLKSDEVVAIVVSGRPAVYAARRTARRFGSSSAPQQWAVARSRSAGQSTKMILRARKADIDNFQKDKLSPEDFHKKVSIIVY